MGAELLKLEDLKTKHETVVVKKLEATSEALELSLQTKSLQQRIWEGESTGDMVTDLLVGQYGPELWEIDRYGLAAHYQSILDYLTDKEGQPVLYGTVLESHSGGYTYELKFGYLTADQPTRSRTGRQLGVVLPLDKQFRFSTTTRYLEGGGIPTDDVLFPTEMPLYLERLNRVSILNLQTASEVEETPSSQRANWLMVGEDAEEYFKVVGKELTYFRMSAMAEHPIEVPEAIQLQYARACIGLAGDILKSVESKRSADGNISERLEQRAKSLGFSSIDAALTYGVGLAQLQLARVPLQA